MADATQSNNGWGFLDKIWETVTSTAGKVLDTINTKNMSEAQIAAANAQAANAAATQSVAPYLGADMTKLGIMAVAGLVAYKLLK